MWPVTGRVDAGRVRSLVNDAAALTGLRRWKVIRDVLLASSSGKGGVGLTRLVGTTVRDGLLPHFLGGRRISRLANMFRL